MATNRFSYSDDFILKDNKVGINSSTPSEKLDVDGSIGATNFEQSGISTFSTYESYLNSDQTIKGNRVVNTSTVSSSISSKISVGVGDTLSISEGTTIGQGNIESLKVTNTFTPPIGGTNDRPTEPKPGALFYNKDFRTIEYWDGNFWRQVDNTTQSGRVIFAGGEMASKSPVATSPTMHHLNINTFGNSTYFGEMVVQRRQTSCCGNTVRSQIWGGQGASSNLNEIDYFTIASEGNAVDFGNMLGQSQTTQALSSSTRGISYGHGEPESNVIQYTEIMSKGGAIDFGDCALATRSGATWASPTRGMLAGGAAKRRHIEYITIASKGVNGTKFGELTEARRGLSGCSNSVRGLAMGGYDGSGSPYTRFKTIDYVTIASTGNAIYFGDLSNAVSSNACAASSIRGINAGGSTPTSVNTIDYVLIASAGNAMDFGDLSEASWNQSAGVSDCHGGLGGY